MVITNWEAILAKNLSRDFQVVMTATRQFQHVDGTWNPTDPARSIQPDAFPNNRDLSRHLFGNGVPVGDPLYGPARVRLANGGTQPNPLSTSWRIAYGTRGDGQIRNETARFRLNSPLYLSRFNRHPPRGYQMTIGYKF